MLLSFDRLPDRPGVEIVDHVEGRQCTVETPDEVEPEEVDVNVFTFPVDRGVSFETEALTFRHPMPVLVRNSMGYQVQELTNGQSKELPADLYTLDLSAPVKLYLIVDAELTVDVRPESVKLEFGERTEVRLGARSYHENPATTITTTSNPEDVMEAVSMLSSSLKTTSVERSYPTLRGHPPTIELGDELDIPHHLEAPDTGVAIRVPPTLRHVYVVSPLAYYLGATVEPGPIPSIVTETGFEHVLDDPATGFEDEVERVLKQVFFLDCLTRTEGFYPLNLHERNVLEAEVDLDFAELYEQSIGEQLEAYLDVPYEVLEPEMPQWKLTSQVSLTPENVEVLPFVVNDLGVVRSPQGATVGKEEVVPSSVNDMIRAGEFTRSSSGSGTATESAAVPELIQPAQSASQEQTWIGEGVPIGASKAMIEAYQNRLERTPADGDIDITVICNDQAMNAERDIVDEIYGSRGELPFDIHGHHELHVEELRAVLEEEESNFLHYIGHIDQRGFECADGFLDASTLDSTGVESFLLNACTSYKQGMELIRAGSVTGVVTLEDVINSGAERIGSTLAKLLNYGFPFNAALEIAKDQSIVGGQYLVLGDGGVDIAQTKSGLPGLCELSVDKKYHMTYVTHTTFDKGMGSLTIPYVGDNSEFYIAGGKTGEFHLSEEELQEFINREIQPIRFEGSLTWSDEIDFDEIDG